MYEKTLKYGKGYAGKLANKCWIARITGTDKKYVLSREFLDADNIEREHFNRARTIIDFTWHLDVGLYEASEQGDRWFFVVWVKQGEHVAFTADDERVKSMVKLMDDGMSAEEARIATKKPAQPAQRA